MLLLLLSLTLLLLLLLLLHSFPGHARVMRLNSSSANLEQVKVAAVRVGDVVQVRGMIRYNSCSRLSCQRLAAQWL
jgi:hypothetical protein